MRRQKSKVCGTPLPHYLAWAKSWRGSIASNASNTPSQPRNIETPTPDRHGEMKDEDHEEGDASGLCTRDALEEILKSYVASESPFSYHKAFPHAPNPELHISGLGDIELPLNQADFDTIKSKCRKLQPQEGVDSCESSSQDRVGCVWALGASEVHLHSTLWPEFMSKIVEETCQTLMGSVLRAGSRPQTRCNLRELLLYETGSRATVAKSRGNGHTSPTQVLVFLPSRFTGGVVQLVCSGKSVRYDCSEGSLETNVIAWQPESTDYEMKRVTDGHRLAILFDLNFDVAPYPVAIPTNIDLLGKLRTVLRRWKLRKSRGPEDTLVYLLRYIYDQDVLCADSLKGVDKIRFSALQCLANELGFQVSLSDCRYFRKQESPRVWDDSDSDDCSSSSDDDDEVAVGGRVVLTGLIDPEGNRVPGHVDLELAETIPRCLRDIVEDDYDKNQIREKGEEQSTFHSESHYSVLVLWDYATLYSGPEGLKQAMKHLKKMLHRGVAFTDLAFIHHVLSRAEEDPQPILHMVCDIACRWDKPNLWMKAVMICYTLKTPAYLSTQKILTAVDELGFASIQAGLECILDAGLSNVTRLELLRRISERAEELPAATPSKITMQEWVASQTSLVLNNLKKPRIEEGEEQALLLAAQSNGGIIFLEEHLLQQILDISDHKFLCTFALSLHYDDDLNSDTKDVIVAKLLSTAISKATFFAIVTRNASELRNWDFPMITGDVTYSEAYPDDAEAYLELVQQLGHSHLFNSVIEKVMDTASLTPLQAQHCAEMLMLPMINFLVTDMHVDHAHASSSKLKELQETGIQLHIDGLLEQERQARDKRIEWTHAVPLLDAALVNMNGEVFMKRVWPYLLDAKMRGDGLRNLTEEVVAKRHAIILPVDHAGPSVQEMITTLAKRAVDRSFDFSDVVADTSRILKLFSFCFKCNTPDLCEEIANKIIAPENLTEGVIEWRLGSFLLQLKEWAEELGRDLDRVVQKIALACVETTPKAPRQRNASHCEYIASLAAWTCGCQLCEDVRQFLKSDRRTYNLQEIGSPSVKHVRKGLQAHARELVTSTLVYTKPQSLSLAKPTAFHRYILWKDGRSRALKFLRDLSPNDDELRRILGPTYSRIHRILGDFSVKVEEDVDLIPVDSQSLPPPSPTSPSQSSPAPRSAHVSRGTIPQGRQETSQSGKRRSNTNPSGRTQVKKQKMGEKDSKTTTGDESEGRQIIDLTLDSDSDSESDVVEYL